MGKILTYILMLLGEGIICTIYFVALKDVEPTNLFYLNLIVTSLVYVLLFINSFNLTKQVSKSSHTVAGFGATIYGVTLYSVAAMAVVVLSYAFSMALWVALVLQAIALFALILFVIFAINTVSAVKESAQQIDNRKESLQFIKSQLTNIEIEIQTNQNLAKYQYITNELKEQLFYLTASSSKEAKDVEFKVANELENMLLIIKSGGSEDDLEKRLTTVFSKVQALLKIRKSIC